MQHPWRQGWKARAEAAALRSAHLGHLAAEPALWKVLGNGRAEVGCLGGLQAQLLGEASKKGLNCSLTAALQSGGGGGR